MVKIVAIKGENLGREFTLTKGKFKIGRGQDNDFLLTEPVVSRNHAEIKYKNGKYLLISSGKNGTKINGKLDKFRCLEDGDVIEIGSTFIKCQGITEGGENFQEPASKANKKVILIFTVLGTIFLIIFCLFSFKVRNQDTSGFSMEAEEIRIPGKMDSPESYFKLARRLYREKEIREENLFLAIQSWQKGLNLLKLRNFNKFRSGLGGVRGKESTCPREVTGSESDRQRGGSPYGSSHEVAILGESGSAETFTIELEKARENLDKKIKNEMFGAYQSYHLGNIPNCKLHLERVLKLIPLCSDKRHQSALAKLKALNQK